MKSPCASSAVRLLSTVLTVAAVLAPSSQAYSQDYATPKWLLSVSGGLAFPTGRFAETNPDADPPKAGHDNGYDASAAIGMFLSPAVAVGVSGDYSRFDIDFEGLPVNPDDRGHTSTVSGHVWIKYQLSGGFARWQPYAKIGLGAGRPTGQVDYDVPVAFSVNDSTVLATKLESVVKTSFSFLAALGVLIPITNQVGISIEPAYRTVSTKGAGRTDKIHTVDGDVFETEIGTDSGGGTVRLKAKSNTDWWEIRGGIVIMI